MATSQGYHSRSRAVLLHAEVSESATLAQLNDQLARDRITYTFNRLSEVIGRYGGEAKKPREDTLIAEFDRASDAVCSALDYQERHTKFLKQLGDEIRPALRIGVSLGEVEFTDNTVTGEHFVRAQRIEHLAEPGGLCITAAIHDALPKHMPFNQVSLGEQEVAGFDEAVRVYRVELKQGESIPSPEQTGKVSAFLRSWAAIFGAVVVVVMAGAVLFWLKS